MTATRFIVTATICAKRTSQVGGTAKRVGTSHAQLEKKRFLRRKPRALGAALLVGTLDF